MPDIVMKFEEPEIKGDSAVLEHEDWIRCETCDFDTSRSIGPIEDRKLGGATFSGFMITRNSDKASADLFAQHLQASTDNAKIGTITIDYVESGGEVNVQIKLTEAYIKEFRIGSSSDSLLETLEIDGEELTLKVGETERVYNYKTRELT